MNGHDEYLELLAASIDFGLTEEEVARLNYHLASCPECRRAATELRGQNAVIATTPIAPLAPARSEQILRAALRKPAAKPRWGMLAVAALLATLGGGVLFAGFQLIDDDDPAPDRRRRSSPRSAPALCSARRGVGRSWARPRTTGPRVTPNPDRPIRRTWASSTSSSRSRTHLRSASSASASRTGGLALVLSGRRDQSLRCSTRAWSPIVVPAPRIACRSAVSDGRRRVRLLCSNSEDDLECVEASATRGRLYAFAGWAAAARLPGRTALGVRRSGSIAGGPRRRRRRARPHGFRSGIDGDPATWGRRGSPVGPNGSLSEGAPVPAPDEVLRDRPERGRRPGHCRRGTTRRSMTTRSTDSAQLPRLARSSRGATSMPGVRPNGSSSSVHGLATKGSRIVCSLETDRPTRRRDLTMTIIYDVCRWDPIAMRRSRRSRTIGATSGWSPMVRSMTSTPERRFRVGRTSRGPASSCSGSARRLTLAASPGTSIRPRRKALDLHPGDRARGARGRINVVNRDGTIRSGWPKTLQREGATWDSVTIGENRRAYAVAIEPEPNNESSISVLAFAPNGTREWIRVSLSLRRRKGVSRPASVTVSVPRGESSR